MRPPQSKVNLALRPAGPDPLTRTADQTIESNTCHHQINRLDGICQTNP
jgi:hypothetical protein